MINDKISIIIPIHNGGKYIPHLYSSILNQSYKNIEIILVENYSNDNSFEIMHSIAEKDNRVIALESKIHGTSLARKMGVEHATGKYTVFMDQDDEYEDNYAIEKMHKTIVTSNSQICQFSFYKQYSFGIKKKVDFTANPMLVSIDNIRKHEMVSLFGGTGLLGRQVWSKIYLTQVLKDAVKKVDISLFFAEDQFLNVCCLTSPNLKNVYIDNSAFYVWKVGVGFSSKKDSGFALLEDYNKSKPIILGILSELECDEKTFFIFHSESLYSLLSYLVVKTKCVPTNDNLKLISDLNNMDYIIMSKKYVNTDMPREFMYEELNFLASDYSPESFCNRFRYRSSKIYKVGCFFRRLNPKVK